MPALESFVQAHFWAPWILLIAAFALLAKCADLFVESAVSLASRLRIPKIVIGIVLVSLATTTPELTVSMSAALRGKPEVAMGNAIGSVICNQGLGISLCALFSAAAVPVIPHVLNRAGGFFVAVSILIFLFTVFDCALDPWEGLVLLALFGFYMYGLWRQHRSGKFHEDVSLETVETVLPHSPGKLTLVFTTTLGGIIVSSNVIVTSTTAIAIQLRVPSAVIALTLVAIGTSIPEIATCITAARKGHGELAVGNILGANIMNICWVAGASAMANQLILTRKEILFMFPALFAISGVTLVLLRTGYRLTRGQGILLLGMYGLYVVSFFVVFRPGG